MTLSEIEEIIPSLPIKEFDNILKWYNQNTSKYTINSKKGAYIDLQTMKKDFMKKTYRKIVGVVTSMYLNIIFLSKKILIKMLSIFFERKMNLVS